MKILTNAPLIERLIERRLLLDITQPIMAAQLNVHVNTFYCWEAERYEPKLSALLAWMAILGLRMDVRVPRI